MTLTPQESKLKDLQIGLAKTIDLMPAGRELDILIGEKLLGWEYIDDLHWKLAGEFMRDGRPFNPSTNIADAWLVVDKMIELFGLEGTNGFILTKYVEKGRMQPYYCEFPKPIWESGEADTAPLAICRAALKAVA